MKATRREFLAMGAAAVPVLWLPVGAARAWDRPPKLGRAIDASPLVYVTPLLGDGRESTCHGEVWFVPDGGDLLVVTNPERWRAAAIGRGLDRARLWVGDYGVWKKADGKFKKAPTCVAKASLEPDPGVHARALEAFGRKYASAWDSWGPRFRKGLASGDRVMIRYSPDL